MCMPVHSDLVHRTSSTFHIEGTTGLEVTYYTKDYPNTARLGVGRTGGLAVRAYAYQTQPQMYYQYQAPANQQHCNVSQGYYYQPLYHCPTCGTPVYVVYVPVPQAAETPKGLAALLVAVLVLLAFDIVFLRQR